MVKSLFQLASAVVIANVRSIWDFGDLPYHCIKHILARIRNPDQLASIQNASPNLKDDLQELWISLINRDFKVIVDKRPLDPVDGDYCDLYYRYKQAELEDTQAAKAKLVNSMAKANTSSFTTGLMDIRNAPRQPRSNWQHTVGTRSDFSANFSRNRTQGAVDFMKKVSKANAARHATGITAFRPPRKSPQLQQISTRPIAQAKLRLPALPIQPSGPFVASSKPPPLPQLATQRAPPVRKGGLLSFAPGANQRGKITAPAKAAAPATSRATIPPTSRAAIPPTSRAAVPATTTSQQQGLKRKTSSSSPPPASGDRTPKRQRSSQATGLLPMRRPR